MEKLFEWLGIAILAIIVAIISAIVAIFTGINWVLAWLTVTIARSRPIRQKFLEKGWQKQAIWLWLWGLPVVTAAIWGYCILVVASWFAFPHWLSWPWAFTGVVMFIYFYFTHYEDRTPKSADWAVFVNTKHSMQLERKLTWIEQMARIRVKWLSLWS